LLLLWYDYSGLVHQNVVLFSKFGLVVKNIFVLFFLRNMGFTNYLKQIVHFVAAISSGMPSS